MKIICYLKLNGPTKKFTCINLWGGITLKPRIWFLKLVIVTAIVIGLPVGGVMGYNYYIDPYWAFTHSNDDNNMQRGFNERVQKTNWLKARAPLHAQNLLIGTSRTTYINASNFEQSIFHYGISALHVQEYLTYIKYAEKHNGQPFDTIFMEISARSFDVEYANRFPDTYARIAETEKEFYRLTHLFSYETLVRSIQNHEIAEIGYSPKPRLYDRDLHVQTFFESRDISKRLYFYQYNQDKREAKNEHENLYDPSYKETLLEIRNSFPNSQFVVFNDPMLMERLEITFTNVHLREGYKRYIRDVVDVFGIFYSFHVESDMTKEHSRYFDLFHYYPETGDQVAEAIQHPENNPFVFAITKNNIEEYFAQLGI